MVNKDLKKAYNLIDYNLSTLSEIINKPYWGKNCKIQGFNLSNRTLQGDNYLSYATSLKFLKKALKQEKISALIITEDLFSEIADNEKENKSFILADFPEFEFYKLFSSIPYPDYNWPTVFSDIKIGKGAIIEEGVLLGKNISIGENTVIKKGSIIGDNTIVGACSVIGGEGFQLIKDKDGKNMNIPHRGRTLIGSNVYVGDNTTISKSLFDGFTEIGDFTKIDNHVHVAHNCKIGDNCVLTAGVTLFGSSELKNNVWMAPNSSVMNRVVVGEGAFVCANSFAAIDVKPNTKVFGMPAMKIK